MHLSPRLVLLSALVIGAAPACRDFDLPEGPGDHRMELQPGQAAVAPREPLLLTVRNGNPPYRFAFAPGSPRSGQDARVDAETGRYVAGSTGSAEDVVQVADSAGAIAYARISVGAPLTLTPRQALVAPGGEVLFTAVGGKAPYTFSLVDAGSSDPAGTGALVDPDVGRYRAGSRGNTADIVRVEDSVGGEPAEAQILVGSPLVLVAPSAAGVAPYERVVFSALGGQAPYTFSLDVPDTAARIDPATGVFEAHQGDLSVTVRVTDANALTAEAHLSVTAALSAYLPPGRLRPGSPVRVVTAGGRPPYTFGFAQKGNLSKGSVDPVTGVYTPGWGVGTADRLEVRDATGRAAVSFEAARIGPVHVPNGGAAVGAAADLDGDGLDEVIGIGVEPSTHLRIASWRWPEPPVDRALYFSGAQVPLAIQLVDDLDGDGRDDLVIRSVGASWVLFGGLGEVDIGPPVIEEGVILGARRQTGADGSFMRFLGRSRQGAPCYGPDRLVQIDWYSGSRVPNAPRCIVLPSDLPFWSGVAGDYDGDGLLDLGLTGTTGGRAKAELYFGPDFTRTRTVDLGPTDQIVGEAMSADLNGDGADELLQIAGRGPFETRIHDLLGVRGGPTPVAIAPFAPMAAGQPQIEGCRAAPIAPGRPASLFTWTIADGVIRRLVLGAGGWEVPPAQPPVQDFRVNQLVLGDANGDRLPDLAVFGYETDETPVIWGEGDGSFGVRPRFGPVSEPRFGDLDADGLTDVIDRRGMSALDVRLGTDLGFAWAGGTPMPLTHRTTGFVDVTGDGADDVIYSTPNEGLFLLPALPGAPELFGPAVPLVDARPDLATLEEACAAELGGTGPGADLLFSPDYWQLRSESPVAVRLDLDQPPEVLELPGPGVFCDFFDPVDLDGDGFTDVVAGCQDPALFPPDTVLLASSAKTLGGRVVGFGGWTEILRAPASGDADALPVTAWGGDPDTRHYVLQGADGYSLVVLDRGRLTTLAFGVEVVGGIAGDLDGDGVFEVIASDPASRLHIFSIEGSSLVPRSVRDAPGRIVGTARLSGGTSTDLVLQSGRDLVVVPY